MKTSSAKAKGRRLQQWVAEQIGKITGLPVGKDEMIASREMGQSGVDVRLIDKAKILFPYSVESKNTEHFNIWQTIEQAKSNQMENTDWLVIAKRNHHAPIAILDAEVFFKLVDKARG